MAWTASSKTEQTCIIVVETRQAGGRLNVGLVVDHVSEVLEIPAGNVEPPPSFGSSTDTDFIVGMGKTQSSVKILLDVDKVVAGHYASVN